MCHIALGDLLVNTTQTHILIWSNLPGFQLHATAACAPGSQGLLRIPVEREIQETQKSKDVIAGVGVLVAQWHQNQRPVLPTHLFVY